MLKITTSIQEAVFQRLQQMAIERQTQRKQQESSGDSDAAPPEPPPIPPITVSTSEDPDVIRLIQPQAERKKPPE